MSHEYRDTFEDGYQACAEDLRDFASRMVTSDPRSYRDNLQARLEELLGGRPHVPPKAIGPAAPRRRAKLPHPAVRENPGAERLGQDAAQTDPVRS